MYHAWKSWSTDIVMSITVQPGTKQKALAGLGITREMDEINLPAWSAKRRQSSWELEVRTTYAFKMKTCTHCNKLQKDRSSLFPWEHVSCSPSIECFLKVKQVWHLKKNHPPNQLIHLPCNRKLNGAVSLPEK